MFCKVLITAEGPGWPSRKKNISQKYCFSSSSSRDINEREDGRVDNCYLRGKLKEPITYNNIIILSKSILYYIIV